MFSSFYLKKTICRNYKRIETKNAKYVILNSEIWGRDFTIGPWRIYRLIQKDVREKVETRGVSMV